MDGGGELSPPDNPANDGSKKMEIDFDQLFSLKKNNDASKKRKASDTDTRLLSLFGGLPSPVINKAHPKTSNLDWLTSPFNSALDSSDPMKSYLSSSLGVSGSSLFSDEELLFTPKQLPSHTPSISLSPKPLGIEQVAKKVQPDQVVREVEVVKEEKMKEVEELAKEVEKEEKGEIDGKKEETKEMNEIKKVEEGGEEGEVFPTAPMGKLPPSRSANLFSSDEEDENDMGYDLDDLSPSPSDPLSFLSKSHLKRVASPSSPPISFPSSDSSLLPLSLSTSSLPTSNHLTTLHLPFSQSSSSIAQMAEDIPKARMMGVDISSHIREGDYGKTSKYSPEILKLAESKDYQALEQLLQPYRDLIAEFTGLIEIQEILQSVEKKVFRQAQNKSTTVTRIKVCRFILFSDQLTLCTNKVEDSIILQQLWISKLHPKKNLPPSPSAPLSPSPVDVFSKALTQVEGDVGNVSFLLKTPEKSYLCFFDSSSKLLSLLHLFRSSLFKLLHPSLPLPPSLSSPLSSDNGEEEESVAKRNFKYRFKNGLQYEGEWKNAKFNGNGKQIMPSGDIYEGLFVNHKRSGFGKLISAEGKYEGFWKHNKRNGKGTLLYQNDKHASKFLGTWIDDMQHGEGELYLKAGTILKTLWKLGVPTNPAVLCFEGDTRYIGDLSDDFLPHGHGICIYHSGDRYYGSWVNGEKSGRGMYTTSKGSEFLGEWVGDKINGQGSYRSSRDEATLQGKFTGNLVDGLEVSGGTFKFHSSAQDGQALRISTMEGEKWDCFFKMRLKNAEMTEQAQVLNEILQRTLSLLDPSSPSSPSVREDLINILYCRNHPLGKLIMEFDSIFLAMYHKPERHFMQLRVAVDDIQSFLSLLSPDFIRTFLACDSLLNEDCSEALHSVLFPAIYDCLFKMYRLYYEEKDRVLDRKFEEIKKFSLREIMAVCGIEQKYWEKIEALEAGNGGREEEIQQALKITGPRFNPSISPFLGAVDSLRRLYEMKTVHGKLECIKLTATYVEGLLKHLVSVFGADEFLPIFCMLMMVAYTPKLESESVFIDDFMAEEIRFSVYGYMLAQLQISTSFLTSCDLSLANLAH